MKVLQQKKKGARSPCSHVPHQGVVGTYMGTESACVYFLLARSGTHSGLYRGSLDGFRNALICL